MLHVYLLGQPRVLYADEPVRLAGLPKTVPLWAYLLLHSAHPVERTTLAFTLWPDAPEPTARANLRRHLQDLRRLLPAPPAGQDWLVVDTQTVAWNPAAPLWLDVAEFERLSDSAATLPEAIALYGGDLLETVYDDWLFHERERLRNRYLTGLDTLVRQSRDRRDYPTAIRYAQQLLETDPLREDMLRLLMAVRYEAGDRSGALQEYAQFARRLQAELAVEPMPETTGLHEAVLRNAPLPGAMPLLELAPAGGEKARALVLPFVGREAELAQLRGLWRSAAQGHGSVVLLGGEAGIGKTRLVAEIAGQAEREGARVLRGSTTFAEPVPYQALVAALRAAWPLLAALALEPVWMAAVAALVPELRTRRGSTADQLPPLAPLDPERERTRLFEGLARALAGLAQARCCWYWRTCTGRARPRRRCWSS